MASIAHTSAVGREAARRAAFDVAVTMSSPGAGAPASPSGRTGAGAALRSAPSSSRIGRFPSVLTASPPPLREWYPVEKRSSTVAPTAGTASRTVART